MKAVLVGWFTLIISLSTLSQEYLLVHRYPNMNAGLFFKQDRSVQREESELFIVENMKRVIALKSYRVVSKADDLYNYLLDSTYSHDVYKTNLTKKEVFDFTKRIKNSGYNHILTMLERTIGRSRFHSFDDSKKEFEDNFNRFKFSPESLEDLLDYANILVPNKYFSEKFFDVHFCKRYECASDKMEILDEDVDYLINSLVKVSNEITNSKQDYLNQGQKEALIHFAEKLIDYEKTFLALGKPDRLKKMWQKFFANLPDDYIIFRNLEEGSLVNNPSYGWLSKVVKKYKSLMKPEDYKRLSSNIDSDFDHLGNGLSSVLVNFLGRVFKKRDWVPSLRLATNFRENYLFENVDSVIDQLLAKDGMKPGDIILEKDRKANTDLLIPGYWVHASIYLGTIKDFKKMGVWDHPRFKEMRKQILKYNNQWREKLDGEYKNTRDFEDVPWFSESDRPGVGVHPLNKFLQTDGMAVIRVNRAKDNEAYVKNILLKSSDYLGLPYDYTHNIKNNRAMTCSKYVLKVFDDITFNTSDNGPYRTVSPDQIGQVVGSGQASLVMFMEAENEGKLIYAPSQKDENAYQVYLNNLY